MAQPGTPSTSTRQDGPYTTPQELASLGAHLESQRRGKLFRAHGLVSRSAAFIAARVITALFVMLVVCSLLYLI